MKGGYQPKNTFKQSPPKSGSKVGGRFERIPYLDNDIVKVEPLSKKDGLCFTHTFIDELHEYKCNDNVNRPAHYTDGKIEVIEFIEDKKLGFCLGNAIKYISRAGKKDPTKEVEDLQKAKWYIERRIKQLEEVEK